MAQCTHHEPTATRDRSSGCNVSQVRRPRLERGGRGFESLHPDHPIRARATLQLLTQPFKGWCQSGNGRGCNPRAWLDHRWFESIPAHHIEHRSISGEISWLSPNADGFESRTVYQASPAGGIGIRAGLRNQILRVRVSGGAPKDSWQNGIAPVLKTESLREPGGVGSTPTLSAKGRLPEWQRVGLLSRSRSAMAAKVRSLHLPPR